MSRSHRRKSRKFLFTKFRAQPEAHPLPTPSGKIEIFSETVDSFEYDDCPGHPTWLEPVEWLGGKIAERFPLHMISNQPQNATARTIGQWKNQPREQNRRT